MEALGGNDAKIARDLGMSSHRFGNYVRGDREPDLAMLVQIAKGLGTTPNWLLGVEETEASDPEKGTLITRFAQAAQLLPNRDVEMLVVQAEAVAKREG